MLLAHTPLPCILLLIHADMAAQVYSLLRRTSWRQHIKLVMVTPDGLPLTTAEAALLPPLSGMSVQSMADFSRRLPPGMKQGQQVGMLAWYMMRFVELAQRALLHHPGHASAFPVD